jgi:hypothetical protein
MKIAHVLIFGQIYRLLCHEYLWHTQSIRQRLPYTETRRRILDRNQGKDDNSENIVKSRDKYLNNLMKFPQFLANVVAFADSQDIAVMLADSVAVEAVESGTYLIS